MFFVEFADVIERGIEEFLLVGGKISYGFGGEHF